MDNKKNNKILGMAPGLFVFLCILAGLVLLAVFIGLLGFGGALNPFGSDVVVLDSIGDDYVAIVHVEGGIYSDGSSGSGGYSHKWTLNEIDALMDDSHNAGILLYVDSPGGEVFAGDELYLKLMDYKETTNRPIYAYFGAHAASGAYYVSCAADKIIANRCCFTGSIGVKIGTFYDLTKLMENYGVDAFDIASGDHKNMGSYFETMDEEEIAIYQGLINEMYERFIEIIAESRNLDIEAVRELSDGRIYSASQALELGLVDEIAGYEDAVAIMSDECGSNKYDLEFIDVYPDYDYSWYDILWLLASSASSRSASGILPSTENDSVKLFFMSDRIAPMFMK